MKKALIFSSVAIFFIATFSSCYKQEDDIYKPKCKIVNVWYDELSGTADEVYTYEDKELNKITYSDDGSYIVITHNKNGTISEIVAYESDGVATGESVSMTYDKTLIATMSFIDDGDVVQKYEFTHSDKKISSIKVYVDESYSKSKVAKSRLYKLCFGDPDQFGNLFDVIGSKSLAFSFEYLLTYTGDNLTNINVETEYYDIHVSMNQIMEYDDMKNPYFGLTFKLANFLGYTKNNPTKMTTNTTYSGGYEETDSEVVNYSYQFNKYDFPTTITEEEQGGNTSSTFLEYDK
jgi:hypothetical protein